jgi:hypothetical protein
VFIEGFIALCELQQLHLSCIKYFIEGFDRREHRESGLVLDTAFFAKKGAHEDVHSI